MSNNTVIQNSYLKPKTTKSLESQTLTNCVDSLELERNQGNLALSFGQTVSHCKPKQASLESWEYFKKRLNQIKFRQLQPNHPTCNFKTKVNYLRVCCSRQIIVVYPDGVWYSQTNLEVIERISQEHLIRHNGGGRISIFDPSCARNFPGFS